MLDIFLQSTNQSLAHRLFRYAQSPDSHCFYPPGFAEEVEEVRPFTDRSGPCLVHCKRTRLSPAQLNAWIVGNSSANAAIVRAYFLNTEPGVALSRRQLVQQLVAAGPAPGGARLRLQCFPRSLEGWLGDELPESMNLQPVDPKYVLNIVRIPEPVGQRQQRKQAAADDQQHAAEQAAVGEQQQAQAAGQWKQQQAHESDQHEQQRLEKQQDANPDPDLEERFVWSLQPAEHLYNYQPVRDKRVPDQLSKAAGKLSEALAAAGIQLTSGVAVDLGAAPGGWTHVLAQKARLVIAVDPADMDSRALVPGVVTHLACKAEDAVGQIRGMVGEAGVDLLVSDVNKHPNTIMDLLRPLLPLLHPGAAVIVTLKFFGRGQGRTEEWQQKLSEQLAPDFVRVQLLWLLANTQHEQTAIAFKAAPQTAGAEDGVIANGKAVEAIAANGVA